MTTRPRDVEQLADAIIQVIDMRIGRDQGLIGAHERATEARRNLGDALKRALGMKVAENAEP